MDADANTQVLDNALNRSGGFIWNRLHSERQDVCEALLKDSQTILATQVGLAGRLNRDATGIENWHQELLQARLRKIDDALDRLTAGTYGSCSRCGRWIEDTKLDFDPAIAFCFECWQRVQSNH